MAEQRFELQNSDTCGKCGGSGYLPEYAFNGGTCFACNGTGKGARWTNKPRKFFQKYLTGVLEGLTKREMCELLYLYAHDASYLVKGAGEMIIKFADMGLLEPDSNGRQVKAVYVEVEGERIWQPLFDWRDYYNDNPATSAPEPAAPQVSVDPAAAPDASERVGKYTTQDGEVVELLGWTRYRPFAVVRYKDGSQFELNVFTDLFDKTGARAYLDSLPTYKPPSTPEPTPDDSSLPFASFDEDSEAVSGSFQGQDNIWQRLNTNKSQSTKPSHGRTSRNRSQKPRNRANSRFKANKVSTTMMEHNDKKQAALRAKYAAEHNVRYPNLLSINPRYWKAVMDTVNDMPLRRTA